MFYYFLTIFEPCLPIDRLRLVYLENNQPNYTGNKNLL